MCFDFKIACKMMYGLPWITREVIHQWFWFDQWLWHEWKSLANYFTSDQEILIQGDPVHYSNYRYCYISQCPMTGTEGQECRKDSWYFTVMGKEHQGSNMAIVAKFSCILPIFIENIWWKPTKKLRIFPYIHQLLLHFSPLLISMLSFAIFPLCIVHS